VAHAKVPEVAKEPQKELPKEAPKAETS